MKRVFYSTWTTQFLTVVACLFLFSCATGNRTSHILSIGPEDLTSKKAINIIIYKKETAKTEHNSDAGRAKLEKAYLSINNAANTLVKSKNIRLNKVISHYGDWLSIANQHFDETEYNWTIQVVDSQYPELKYQNFSDDINSSKEVHFRYCKERTIQFANITPYKLSSNIEYWHNEINVASISALHLLMKGNVNLTPTQIVNYEGQKVIGTTLGESDKYYFVLKGEQEIYIVPKQ